MKDQVHLGWTQRECKPNSKIVQENSLARISDLGRFFKPLLGWEKSHADAIAWSHGMEGHASKCVERKCELANQKNQQ